RDRHGNAEAVGDHERRSRRAGGAPCPAWNGDRGHVGIENSVTRIDRIEGAPHGVSLRATVREQHLAADQVGPGFECVAPQCNVRPIVWDGSGAGGQRHGLHVDDAGLPLVALVALVTLRTLRTTAVQHRARAVLVGVFFRITLPVAVLVPTVRTVESGIAFGSAIAFGTRGTPGSLRAPRTRIALVTLWTLRSGGAGLAWKASGTRGPYVTGVASWA